jgi:hypothetical protein
MAMPAAAFAHGKAHQHGVATMDVVVTGQQLVIELETPLDNVVGFERAPRTAAERERVQRATEQLRASNTLFKPDAAAACKPTGVTLKAPALGLQDGAGTSPGTAAPAETAHADLEARFEFTCAAPAQLQTLDVGLFATFKGFKRIEVQMARDGKQGKRSLTPAAARLTLPR